MISNKDFDLSIALDNYKPFLFMKISDGSSLYSFHNSRNYLFTDVPNKTFINNSKIDLFGYTCKIVEYDISSKKYIGFNEEDKVFIVINNDNELQFTSSGFKDIYSYAFNVSFYATTLDALENVIDKVDIEYKKKCKIASKYYINTLISLIGSTQTIKEKSYMSDIEGNYNKDAVDNIGNIYEVLNTNNGTSGRMAIFTGEPGTGKSACLNAIASGAYEMGYRIVSASTYNIFKNSDVLDTEDKTLFIFDDVSWMSSGRVSDDAKAYFLDKFSNVHGSNDFFIFSTNDELYNLDAALIRPGRCFQSVEFTKLPKIKFKDVLSVIATKNKINVKKILLELKDYSELTLAQIYQYALAGTINQVNITKKNTTNLKEVQGLN